MSGLIWLDPDTPMPRPDDAMPEGLLAAGLDLSVTRLTEAYSKGVFPWFNPGEPVLWWSPDPRMVLKCTDFKVSRSLGKKLRQIAREERSPTARIVVTTDLAFHQVIRACAGPRSNQPGTWISKAIVAAYSQWHAMGKVHSVETWVNGELAGGLYGVCLGSVFYGESMFCKVTDSSKIALAYLIRFLERHGVTHIDCQQDTPHMRSLGADVISRQDFLTLLGDALANSSPKWQAGQLLHDGRLRPLDGTAARESKEGA